MNLKLSTFLLLSSSICAVSLFINSSTAYGKRGLDECFETSSSGEKYSIPCQAPSEAMSASEIQESLELFRDFEKSSIRDEVLEAAKQRDILLAKNPLPVSPMMKILEANEIDKHKTQTREEYNSAWEANNEAHQKAVLARIEFDKDLNLRPEMVSKVGSIVGGRYRVSIAYINDSNFPKKSRKHNVFRENKTTSYANDWKSIIFTHYLGGGYSAYSPELGVVNEFVRITAFVAGSAELESLVSGKPVNSITHIGTPVGWIEQGEPPIRSK